jgi:hypothetical protein
MYSELPTTFIITGGNGSYLVTSSDQAALPVSGSFSGGSGLTLVPNQVAADVPVKLTIRDTGSSTPATADLTIKPRTLSNVVTITPSASQSVVCGTAVCAGGDAEVKVTLSQAGLPLRGREVRFEVVSGEFRIITSAAGLPEVLSLSGTTFSDESGTARMRIRVLNDAISQTDLIQITDVTSGSTQRASFVVAPSSNAPLNAQPSTISFKSVIAGICASGLRADVIVFGGRPPYSISQPGTFDVFPTVVDRSGGRFTVISKGQCTDGSQIAVVDSGGATVSVTASATTAFVVNQPPLVVSPKAVTLDSCNAIAHVNIAGGVGPPYLGASGNSAVSVTIDNFSSSSASIARVKGAGPVLPSTIGTNPTVLVSLSDGQSAAEVTVTLVGEAASTACNK